MDDADGCLEQACFEGVECEDNLAPEEGATCGECPEGFSGDGTKCLGKCFPSSALVVIHLYAWTNYEDFKMCMLETLYHCTT